MSGDSTNVSESRAPVLCEGSGNVLLLSMRRVHDLVAFCAPYEFEDVIREVTGAARVDPVDFENVEWARRAYKTIRNATGSRTLAKRLSPGPKTVRLDRDYELFFPVFNHPYELFALATIPGWKDRCRVSACFVSEIWVRDLSGYLLELLADFDHVFVGVQHSAAEVSRITGRPCTYLPLAADVLKFAPAPADGPRPIDVCNIGRRSPVTHEALLGLARERRIFYYFDTVRASGAGGKQLTFHVGNPGEHRLLLASLLQRSRYFIANRSRINEPEFTDEPDVISGRFYEGIAAGTVLLGEAPRSTEFARQFDWPDAVMELPFHSPDVGARLEAIESNLDRVAQARGNNLRNAATRHDWMHRLETVFQAVGVEPTQGMKARRAALTGLSDSITIAAPRGR